jgi:hypothetical protein
MSKRSMDIRCRVAAFLSIAASVVACGDISITNTGNGNVRGCALSWDSKFPTNGAFTMETPTNCPFKVGGSTYLAYAANGSFPGASTLQQYQLTMSDRLGRTFSAFYSSSWSYAGSNNILIVTGNYWAATGGFDSQDKGFDKSDNQILTGQGWSHGLGTLSYVFGTPGVFLKAPARVGNGVTFNVSAKTDDPTWVTPVTWSWRVNGTPIQNSGSLLQWEGNGSNQSIGMTGTDYHGYTHSALIQVGACPGTQINC